MESNVNEDRLLVQFDRLIEKGMVFYNPNHRTVVRPDKGISFEFRILDSHAAKPQAPSDPQKHSSSQQPGCRPGSDINVSGYEVAMIGSTHLLTVNKFPSMRPHFLILTQNGFRRQFEALDINDLTAARQVISSMRSRHLMLFNCGINGGCSRMHKHMQVIPAPHGIPLWPDSTQPQLPFKFSMHRFRGRLPPADELLSIYRALLRRAERALGHATLEGEAAVPHNVIMDRNWLVVVPRRSAGWDGIDTNAAGMLGMVWVKSEEKMNIWLERGPANVLARLGVQADAI